MQNNNATQELKLLRFADLRAAGVVSNWTTLSRWIRRGHFPQPVRLGPNMTAWRLSDVRRWLDERQGEAVRIDPEAA